MPFAPFVLLALAPLQRPGSQEVTASDFVYAAIGGDWALAETYRRRAGSFKHPMTKGDANRSDVLTYFAQYGSAADKYGNALTGMRIALENGADPNEGGGKPLMYVVGSDRWGKMVERLLKAGADPNKPQQSPPLRTAIKGQYVASVGHLLAAGAKPNILVQSTLYRRPSPTYRRPYPGEWNSIKNTYPTRNEKTYLLNLAARVGNPKVVSLLLTYKAKVDARDPQTGGTALHEAAETDHAEVVRVLLKAGASRSAKDRAGRTPLAAARRFGAKAAARALGG